jgi:hypothetical protein
MLDVRPLAYVAPVAEQEIGPLTPIATVKNFADEDARIFALFRIYRESLGTLEYDSVSATVELLHGQTTSLAALTPYDPGAPADDDYFILCGITVQSISTGQLEVVELGQYWFDVKPAPMGPVPATHHTTHEAGGMDPVDVSGMPGLLADPQTPTNHVTTHEDGGADPLNVDGLFGELADDQPALQHDLADPIKHTSAATPGQILQADTNGLPTDATNTDADVAATVLESKPQTLTDQANIDWDITLGGAAQVTLGGDRTLNAPTNMVNGARYRLKVIQDGTGTRLIAWNAAYRFPGGVDPCLTAAINCIDILIFDCDGTHMDCVSMVNALA